ncbi:MAG: hypothetical protein U1F49_18970 [Rubrivivax sp.]
MHAVSRIAEAPADERGAAAAMAAAAAARSEAADPRDALTQTLFAANLVAGTLSADPALPESAREQACTLARLVRGALGQTRLLVFDRPPGCDGSEGNDTPAPTFAQRLHDAAAALAACAGREVRVQAEEGAESEPPPALASELCRLVQAALAQAEGRQRRQPRAQRPILSTCAGRPALLVRGRRRRRSPASPSAAAKRACRSRSN